ncbi:unnamed protein product [Allacma fusca]|uniref:Uncharacterized protein n=1 Tax=Allacma fusca TaxID=39272 RepID=A0A8J2KH31_9HEXA|nr:unnamed protein product [Allacma fusca]
MASCQEFGKSREIAVIIQRLIPQFTKTLTDITLHQDLITATSREANARPGKHQLSCPNNTSLSIKYISFVFVHKPPEF